MPTLVAIEMAITNRLGQNIGTMIAEEHRGDWVSGEFVNGSDYPIVEKHFQYFAELVEDQILSILPETKALLFGIRIVTVPLSELCTIEPASASGLRRALATITDEMAGYKNIAAVRAEVGELLRSS